MHHVICTCGSAQVIHWLRCLRLWHTSFFFQITFKAAPICQNFFARRCCVEWDGKVGCGVGQSVENRGVRVRDRESQTSELSGERHSCRVYRRWQESILDIHTGIDSTDCWVYQVTWQCIENDGGDRRVYTGYTGIESTVCLVYHITWQCLGYTSSKRRVCRVYLP